jgi:hypothetical protein
MEVACSLAVASAPAPTGTDVSRKLTLELRNILRPRWDLWPAHFHLELYQGKFKSNSNRGINILGSYSDYKIAMFNFRDA